MNCCRLSIALSPGADSNVLSPPANSGARRRSSTIAFINIADDKVYDIVSQ